MKRLTPYKKQLLMDFTDWTCEMCHKVKENLVIHRIHRGYLGGEYILRNIMVICSDCHKNVHYKEFQ